MTVTSAPWVLPQQGRQQICRRNVPWRSTTNVWVISGIDVPDAGDVRDLLRRLGRTPAGRASAMLSLLDPRTGHRAPVPAQDWDAYVESLVVTSNDDYDPTALMTAERARPIGVLPFRLTLGLGWVTLHFNHALGDVGAVWPAFTAMLNPDLELDFPVVPESGMRPVMGALRATFARDPKQLRAAFADRRDPMPLQTSGETVAQPETVGLVRTSEKGYRIRLKQADGRKGVTPVSLVTARAFAVAAELGLPLHPGAAMAVDCRRYAGHRDYIDGNFCAGVYLGFDEPTDAVEIADRLDTLVESGRPLLTMLVMAATAHRGVQEHHPNAPDPQGRNLLSVSNIGKLPWPRGRTRPAVITGTAQAVGDRGISLIVTDNGPTITIGMSYAKGFQDDALMERFLETVLAG